MTLIIAGERSGVGKTTITLAILAYLSQKGYHIQSFKVGPDYIDPMFHAAVTGHPCYNLDPILTSKSYVQSCLQKYSQDKDLAIIEGVMGLFDGLPVKDYLDYGSTAHLARLVNVPIVLVIDCARLSTSVAAIAQGYRSFDSSVKVIGVILNRVKSSRHLEFLEAALDSISMPILGVLRPSDRLTIPARHLGLVPTRELAGLGGLMEELASLAEHNFNWEKLLPLLQVSPSTPCNTPQLEPIGSVPIAIAQDKAFSFYYQDQLELLQELGAELLPWSPLTDPSPPPQAKGLLFGGGFPEVFAQQLSENHTCRLAISQAIHKGMPTYAECGGLMYLSSQLTTQLEQHWAMVGVIPTQTTMTPTLTLGYRQATALTDTFLLKKGETVIGHEFHYSQITQVNAEPLFKMTPYGQATASDQSEGWSRNNLQASYLHLHFAGKIQLAQRFLSNCLDFSTKAS